jgi:hypothetical protein
MRLAPPLKIFLKELIVTRKQPQPSKQQKKPKKISRRLQTQLRQAGLPEPATQSKAEFVAIQKQWYSKLADNGFKDIEWTSTSGRGQNSDYLRGSLAGGKAHHPTRQLYYQMATNYYVHCLGRRGNGPKYKASMDKFLWRLHMRGINYHEIAKLAETKYGQNAPSVYTIYYRIQHIAKLSYKWNCKHPEGLLRKRHEDDLEKENRLTGEYEPDYDWTMSGNLSDFVTKE